MAKPQHTGPDGRVEATAAAQDDELEAGVDWLDEAHVTLIEESAEPEAHRPERFEHTQRIWLPPA